MKKILLTGGNGFIGKNLQESFLQEKYRLVAPRSGEVDFTDTSAVDAFFAQNEFDAVIHSAVKPGHRNAQDPTNLLYANLRMFLNLERHKNSFGKLVNLGSGAVYDVAQNNRAVREDTLFQNFGVDEHSYCKYTISKLIEHIPNFVDLNIFGVFGKYEDYAIRFISNAICKALFGLPITLRQNRRFSYLDVADLPCIIDYFLEHDVEHKGYNIVPDSFVELKWIAEAIQNVSCKKLDIHIASEGYGLDYYGNNNRLKNEYKDVYFTPIQQSIESLYAFYDSIKHKINYNNLLNDK